MIAAIIVVAVILGLALFCVLALIVHVVIFPSQISEN
jgi:hypothetical protein